MRDAFKKIPKRIDREKEKQLQQEPLEKGDRFSMLLAAFLTLFLPCALLLLLLGGLAYLLFAVW